MFSLVARMMVLQVVLMVVFSFETSVLGERFLVVSFFTYNYDEVIVSREKVQEFKTWLG